MTQEQEFEYDPEIEEVDVEPFEGDPDFENSPSTNTDNYDGQDDAGGSDA